MKQKKRIIILGAFIALLAQGTIFSQEYKMGDTDLLVTFGPLGLLNTQPQSAPSPIRFSFGAGAQVRILEQMSITPHATFFTNFYSWDGTDAFPSELEHRSAYVTSIMLDIPATWDIRTGNSIFRLGGGVSFLFRYAFLANDVPTSVQGDIDAINSWFWKSAEFFYPSIQMSWDYRYDDGMSVGLGLKAYLPVGSLIKGHGINNGIASIGVRLGV